VAKVLVRTLEFAFYQLLICFVDRLSRLPRDSCPPDAMRLYRENLALKVQLDALVAEVTRVDGKKTRVSLRTRAAQVWAYLVTRGNPPFQKHNLSASPRTIQRWATKFRQGVQWRSEPKTQRGRPPTTEEIVELVLALKRENMHWGQKKICQALRRMGVQVSAPTVQKILEEHGLGPPGGGRTWEAYASAAKDALWALDFFVVRSLHGQLLQVMAVIDVYTRELLALRAYDGWDVDSAWTMRTLAAAMSQSNRRPTAVMHDRAPQFAEQVARQLRVLEVDQCRLPPRLPALNGILERTVKSLRWELLDHIRVATVEQLQWYLDEYRAYWNSERCHQGIDGQTPADRADGSPVADVLDPSELRRRTLVRRSFAHGLLNSYSLEPVAEAA
jgi:transposase InsO family protein